MYLCPALRSKQKGFRYRVRFQSQIPHVKLIFANEECLAEAFKFVKDNCYNHLKILEIMFSSKLIQNNGDFSINEAEVFAEQLKELEYLVLFYILFTDRRNLVPFGMSHLPEFTRVEYR